MSTGASEQAESGELAEARAKLEELRARLREPEEIVRAIREGEVDSFVVSHPEGDRIYALRSADVLFRTMVEEMKEGAVAVEPSGLIVYANRYFADLMKAERSTLVGASLFPFVPEESRRFFEALGARSGAELNRSEIILRSSDGLPLPVHVTMNRIVLEGSPVFCLIVTDLTDERRREQLLAEGRRKDEFMAMLAHELRSPIAPIRAAAQVIGLGASDSRVQWAREVIERQVTQLSRLVDDLLDVSRITRGTIRVEMQPVQLQMVVARGIETARPVIEGRRHQFNVDISAGQARVMGDPARLSQVVSNILQNAAKFTPEHGEIWIRIEQSGLEGRIVIRDNGIGLRPEMLSRIFDMFTQVDATLERSQGGLGIGLALVRNLVELHDGRIEARSDGPNRGSEFIVSLPLLAEGAADALPPQTQIAATAPATGPGIRRVLVVDDNEDAAESLTVLLEQMGHEVRTLTDGHKVQETARSFRPHVILLDISLPDVSGFQLAEELRRGVDPDVCLIALTGYGHEEYRRRSREAGFDHHWVKPLDFRSLERVLASLPARADDLESPLPER
jgi:PAS domain S-box-containing protein